MLAERGAPTLVDRRLGGVDRGPRLAHRPALDGLRGAAVLSVLLYHTGVLRGGWIGVDTFFVLSGYLITSLLLAEHDRTGGIALKVFWGRRARRLLPALFLLLAGVGLFAALVATAEARSVIRQDLSGALTYSSNWLDIVRRLGLLADRSRSPARSPTSGAWRSRSSSTWSGRSWPGGRCDAAARGGWSTVAAAGGVVLAAWAIGLAWTGASVDRLYLGTDTRAPALLLGATLGALRVGTARPELRRRGPRRGSAGDGPARLGGVHPRRPGPRGLPGRAARRVAGRRAGRRRGQPGRRRVVRPGRGVAAAVRPRAPELRHLPRPLADPAGRPALVPPRSVGHHRRRRAAHRSPWRPPATSSSSTPSASAAASRGPGPALLPVLAAGCVLAAVARHGRRPSRAAVRRRAEHCSPRCPPRTPSTSTPVDRAIHPPRDAGRVRHAPADDRGPPDDGSRDDPRPAATPPRSRPPRWPPRSRPRRRRPAGRPDAPPAPVARRGCWRSATRSPTPCPPPSTTTGQRSAIDVAVRAAPGCTADDQRTAYRDRPDHQKEPSVCPTIVQRWPRDVERFQPDLVAPALRRVRQRMARRRAAPGRLRPGLPRPLRRAPRPCHRHPDRRWRTARRGPARLQPCLRRRGGGRRHRGLPHRDLHGRGRPPRRPRQHPAPRPVRLPDQGHLRLDAGRRPTGCASTASTTADAAARLASQWILDQLVQPAA